ncbi:MAG TPA: HTH domain-containing protein [Polyangiaceae bacterium]|nr:HTH domain-containing protein [Polyangiaceae bacterium]
MDSGLSTASRALSVGDPIGALKFVGLRNDPPALALRGIALAQLGELKDARALLVRAVKAFEPGEQLARARCLVAQAEISLATRDLAGANRGLAAARELLMARGEWDNALLAGLIDVRRLALLGDVDAARASFDALSRTRVSSRLQALAELTTADLAIKRLDCAAAQRALRAAREAALASSIPQLVAEAQRASDQFEAPVARLRRAGEESDLNLSQLSGLYASHDFIVDVCQREVRSGMKRVNLVRRPVLLELAQSLAASAPSSVSRELLIERVFGARKINDSHRVRLRVEIGRLRKLLKEVAQIVSTHGGFALEPTSSRPVALVTPAMDGARSALLALLRSGESWSTSALAEALGKSQRAVQRALSELEALGKVRASGKARAQRWVAAPGAQIATTLLLVAPGTLG